MLYCIETYCIVLYCEVLYCIVVYYCSNSSSSCSFSNFCVFRFFMPLFVSSQNDHVPIETKQFPKIHEILWLKSLTTLFPVTDFKHPVITPAMLLIGECLEACHVPSTTSLLRGLLLCSTMLHVRRRSTYLLFLAL